MYENRIFEAPREYLNLIDDIQASEELILSLHLYRLKQLCKGWAKCNAFAQLKVSTSDFNFLTIRLYPRLLSSGLVI